MNPSSKIGVTLGAIVAAAVGGVTAAHEIPASNSTDIQLSANTPTQSAAPAPTPTPTQTPTKIASKPSTTVASTRTTKTVTRTSRESEGEGEGDDDSGSYSSATNNTSNTSNNTSNASSNASTVANTSTASSQTTTSSSASTQTASTYKNGTYTATGSYDSPAGIEQISVSITLSNDIITNSSVTPLATDHTSSRYQNMFISGYKQYVVGQNIDSVNLTYVSGSSLTPIGFDNALSTIKAQAKA